jgi:hypothetical protein
MTSKKLIPQLAIDSEFFHRRIYQSLYDVCKTKGAVGAVCALLRNWQLYASLPITVGDGALNKELSQDRGRE